MTRVGGGHGRWTMLALLCLARVSMSLHLQVPAALAPFLIAELGFGYAEIGLLLGLFMLPGALVALPGGLVSDRIGDKATLLGGLALLSIGTGLLAATSGLGLAIPARVVSGTGGVLVTMQVAKMATGWFAGREVATALGCVLGTFPLGIALALATLGTLAGAGSWHAAVGSTAAWTTLTLALVAWLYRDPPRWQAADDRRPSLWSLAPGEVRLALLGGLAFGLVNAAWVVFMGFTPALLAERGITAAEANAVVSWGSWVSIGSIVAAGYFLDRLGRA
ncbi:MAG: MFS transporter, partial [Chloroflexota bacterium]|nr:MFS transporter [Chloroflexota bacterium]